MIISKKFRLSGLAALLLICMPQLVMAQFGGGGRGMGGPGGVGMGVLIGLEQVQKELKLTPEQTTKVKDIAKAHQDELQKMRGAFGFGKGKGDGGSELSQEDLQKRMKENQEKRAKLDGDTKKKIEEAVQPEQLKRLKEIVWQIQGNAALSDPEVAIVLKISDEQKKSLQEAYQAANAKRAEAFQAAAGDFAAAREKGRQIQKELDEQIGKILTGEQNEKFAALKGAKIEIDMSQIQGFGGGKGGFGKGKGKGKGDGNKGGEEKKKG